MNKLLHHLLGDGLAFIGALVVSLNFGDELLHFLYLAIPLLLSHLGLTTEQLLVWLAVAATKSIPESGILAVI